MSKRQVLTIAGSDSGGGAGIQADVKTFQERNVFGTSVITAVTAQNTLGVHGIYNVPLEGVRAQMDAVFSDLDIAALKTGMLVDESYITLIADELATHPDI
ncbi:MAG: bifunctional hydroxymethylpyrimidine kinase/phosphomethylpyrimidine kinase, partial [Alkalibacterium gilvum]